MQKMLLLIITCISMLQQLSATALSQKELLESYLRFLPSWVDISLISTESSPNSRLVPYIQGMSVKESWTTPHKKEIFLLGNDGVSIKDKVCCIYDDNEKEKRLKKIVLSAGIELVLEYDNLRRLTSIGFKDLITTLSYDSEGRIQKIQQLDEEETIFSYGSTSGTQFIVRKITKNGVSRSIYSKQDRIELTILDNGTEDQADDYTNVTWRHWRRKTLSSKDKVLLLEQGVVDIGSGKDQLLSRTSFLYRDNGTLFQTKAVCSDQPQETITDYDDCERVIRVTNGKENASISYAEIWDPSQNELIFIQTIREKDGSQIDKRATQSGRYGELIKKDQFGNTIWKETTSYDDSTKKSKKEKVIYSPEGEIASYEAYEWKKNRFNKLESLSQVSITGNKKTTYYDYDSVGNTLCTTKPDGVKINYSYELGKLSRISSSDGSVDYTISYDDNGQIVSSYDGINHVKYDRSTSQNGEIVTEVYGNVRLQFTSKNKKRLSTSLPDGSTIYYTTSDGAEKIIHENVDGNRLFETMTATSSAPKEEDKLINENKQLAKKVSKDVLRDDFGNIIDDGQSLYAYDANGNLIQKGSTHYSYDALNRLQKIAVGEDVRAVFEYDVFNRKIREISYFSGNVIEEKTFIWDGVEEIGEMVHGSIQNLKIIATPGEMLSAPTRAIFSQGNYFLTETDRRGSITSIIEPGTKSAIETYAYDIYGNSTVYDKQLEEKEKGLSPWRYSGKRLCCDSEALYYGQRHYMPAISRWMSYDPLTFVDGGNQTAFAKGDSVSNIDYQGLFSWPAVLSNVKSEVVKALTNIVQGSIDSLTFAQESLDWFIDFRSHFEDMAFKAVEKSFFTYLGYNPHETHQGDVGRNLSDKVRITSINGILNAYETAVVNSKLISDLHGGAFVHYIYSKTEGFSADLLRCLVIKAGFVSPQAKELAATWKKLIKDMGGIGAGGSIIHYAHSLGGADTLAALNLLSDDEKKMIRITTFGSATLIPNSNTHSVLNYISTNDAVPAIADPIRYLFAAYGHGDNIAFVDSKNGVPLLDHFLNGATYTTVLEELGREYQNSYLLDEPRGKIIAPLGGIKQKGLVRFPKAVPADSIAQLIDEKNFVALGKEIVEHWNKGITKEALIELASQRNCQEILEAIDSVSNIAVLGEEIGLSESKLLQTCLYIESKILADPPTKDCYFKHKETGLSADVEYYHKKGYVFIHKSSNSACYIDRGAWKIVTKSIQYNRSKSQIVARCVTHRAGNKLEVRLHNQFSRCEGLVETIANIPRKYIQGKRAYDIILKYYNEPSLNIFLFSQNHEELSRYDRMKLCASVTKGLATMHLNNIIHRDISRYNCLMHKEQKSSIDKIQYTIALCDFGHSLPVSACSGIIAQFIQLYRAPEAIKFRSLEGRDYFGTDVFAVGCLVYQLYYGKEPAWFSTKHYPVAGSSEATKEKAKRRLAALIFRSMRNEQKTIIEKQKAKIQLTSEEEFEKVIFQMLHPNPQKRISAKLAHRAMTGILSRNS